MHTLTMRGQMATVWSAYVGAQIPRNLGHLGPPEWTPTQPFMREAIDLSCARISLSEKRLMRLDHCDTTMTGMLMPPNLTPLREMLQVSKNITCL